MKIKFFNSSCATAQQLWNNIKLPPKGRWAAMGIVKDVVYTSVFSGKPEMYHFQSNFQHDK